MNDTPIARRNVVIPNKDPNGFHLRPAQAFVKLALRYKSKIELVREMIRVDAKSIFDVLTIGGEPGVEITLEAQGDDAEQALDELARFIESGFEDSTTCQNPAQ
jgi:phosphocarrier protein HPr